MVLEALPPPKLAVILGETVALTGEVVTGKVTLIAVLASVTLAGTLAAPGVSLVRLTTAPAGAGLLNVAVPVEPVPPATLLGLKETAVGTAA
jgi:predicted ABC-type transport system involved in lysophospholipase L1 biosynthesis ATPase subunit